MNAVVSMAVILIVSCFLAGVFFLMAVGGGDHYFEEPGEIDDTDYSGVEEEYYR